MKVAYFVHDLNDAAVVRRVRMMHAGGLAVVILGFWRGESAPSAIDGALVVDLGRTQDGRLKQRALAVLARLIDNRRIVDAVRDCDVFVARNLEALVLAGRASRGRRLVYECLDLHHMLLGTRWIDRLVQAVEARWLARISLLLVSSPAFITHHFAHRPTLTAPTLLIENKVLDPRADLRADGRPAGPPWRIGWFGMLRCRRSLSLLARLAAESDGRIEILIAGRPALDVMPDFHERVATSPGVEYAGAYGPDDLASLYGRVHFAWAIDYFEEGLNSNWLLPNRLYEASYHGAIPIALQAVQTGRWLAEHGAGLVVGEPLSALPVRLEAMSPAAYETERSRLAAIPSSDLVITDTDCFNLSRALEGGE